MQLIVHALLVSISEWDNGFFCIWLHDFNVTLFWEASIYVPVAIDPIIIIV